MRFHIEHSHKCHFCSYSQAKNQFLSNTHECHSYHRGEDEKASVDVEGHVCSSPGYRGKRQQVQCNSKKNLLSKGDEVNPWLSFLCRKSMCLLPLQEKTRKLKFIYLYRVQEKCCQAQPAVETVHVGYFGSIMEVKNCHHGYDGKHKGQHVQACMDELHQLFAAPPGPWESEHNDGCNRAVTL